MTAIAKDIEEEILDKELIKNSDRNNADNGSFGHDTDHLIDCYSACRIPQSFVQDRRIVLVLRWLGSVSSTSVTSFLHISWQGSYRIAIPASQIYRTSSCFSHVVSFWLIYLLATLVSGLMYRFSVVTYTAKYARCEIL